MTDAEKLERIRELIEKYERLDGTERIFSLAVILAIKEVVKRDEER